MPRVFALAVAVSVAGCGAITGLEAPDAARVPAAPADAGCDGPATVTESDGRPLRCGARACDPATEFCFDCAGGGGCSGSSECRPLPPCRACGACDCARATVHCAYTTYCSVRNDVLTVACPPD